MTAGDWITHQGASCEWFGVVMSGELELLHGSHGDPRAVGRLAQGAMVSEGFLLGDPGPHRVSTRSSGTVTVLTLDAAATARLRAEHAEVWPELILRVAQRRQ